MGNCGGCQWWRGGELFPDPPGWGFCRLMSSTENEPDAPTWQPPVKTRAFAQFDGSHAEQVSAIVVTAPDFGCVQWAAKGQA